MAARMRPDWPAPANAAAWILATNRQGRTNDPTEAVRLAERAVELTEHKDAAFLDTLAAAYAAAGDFDRAVSTAKAALALASETDAVELADRLRSRLELYQQRQPYREQ